MIEKECPICGKMMKNLAAHIRLAHGQAGTEETSTAPNAEISGNAPELAQELAGSGTTQADTPTFDASALGLPPEMIQQMAEQYLSPMMARIAVEAATQVGNDLISRFDAIIDMKLMAKFNQLEAQVQERTQAGPPQPSTSRTSEIMEIVGAASRMGLIGGTNNPAPADAFVKQIEAVGNVIKAIDTIRGTSSSPMAPTAALQWAKWGHQLGREGSPLPEYPSASTHVPPSKQMGETPSG